MKNLLSLESNVSMRQFSFFRFIFGLYLSWHFAALIPYAGEIFSGDGIMGAAGLNPFEGEWPNPFFIWKAPMFIQVSLALGVGASALIMLGKLRRSAALFLWFLHSCLYTANPLTANPSLGYVGMLLLLCAIAPHKFDNLPGWIPRTAWILLAVGYSFSGLLKLGSPSWLDGSALLHLMHNPLARPGLARDIMLSLPDGFLVVMTWGTLALEVLFVPLACFRCTRPYAWSAMFLMHLGIMMTVDFSDLSLGMIMVHLFTFQKSWINAWNSLWNQVANTVRGIMHRSPKSKAVHLLIAGIILSGFISACSNSAPHNGIFPFSAMEKPASERSVKRRLKHTGQRACKMSVLVQYNSNKDQADYSRSIAQLRVGDVIAFYMSHAEARDYLKRKKIQKLPYELFRYGHVSVIVPDPSKKLRGQSRTDYRLLQVAMKQAVTANDSLDYLKNTSWTAYRPPAGSIDIARLHAFCRESVRKCNSPEESYDLHATFGLGNGNLTPRSLDDVRDQYTCATLIVAALSYSGFDLYAEKRNGRLDVLTPRQVTDAWGVVRAKKNH